MTGLWTNITDEMIDQARAEEDEKKRQREEEENELMKAVMLSGKDGGPRGASEEVETKATIDKGNKQAG